MAVCARCAGIYVGFLAGLLATPVCRGFGGVRMPPARILAVLTSPLALDAAANLLGLWNTANLPRFLIGFVWGLVLPFYFLAGIGEIALRGLAIPPPKK